ncbi:MAG: NADH-quinone oxidoreductase subunit K [Bacteroidota bacterium]
MQTLLALLTGVLFAAGVYLILRRNMLRMIFGLVLLSNAVNLLVFSMGRVERLAPPLVAPGEVAPLVAVANPLPQALVLTAVVIGFGLISFALVLVYRSFVTLGTVETDALGPEDLGSEAAAPEPPPWVQAQIAEPTTALPEPVAR